MPNKVVQIDGVGNVQFPDSMSDDQIGQASKTLYRGASAKGIEANPPGVQKPSLKMEMSNWGANPDNVYSGPGAWPNPEASKIAGDSPTYRTAVGAPVAAAAAYMGGSNLLPLAQAYPKITGVAAIEASHYLPGAAGRIARHIPSWTGMMAGREPPTLDSETGEEIEGAQPRLRQLISGEVAPAAGPSGRFVLSPDEAAAQDQQMSLAQKMARQRGMQYAAGMKPSQ